MKNLKVGIITQARTTSTRLPKKVLMPLSNITVLKHHLNRLEWAGLPIYVATTINSSDDAIVDLCQSSSIPYYRGSESDVLARFYGCAKENHLDVVVRVTSDCPLIDGKEILKGVQLYLEMGGNSYVSNCIERTYPRGMDFEIFSFAALENAFHHAVDEADREHVTPFIRNKDKNIGVGLYSITRDHDSSNIRITLDEEADLQLLKALIEDHQMGTKTASEIISFLEHHPELVALNSHVEQKKV